MDYKRILHKYDGCLNPVYVYARDGTSVRFDVAIRCMDAQILAAIDNIEADEQTIFNLYASAHKRMKRQEWELYRTIPQSIKNRDK